MKKVFRKSNNDPIKIIQKHAKYCRESRNKNKTPKSLIEKHKKYKELDFGNRSLSDIDLTDINLSGSIIKNAVMHENKLTRVNLSDATLENVKLTNMTLDKTISFNRTTFNNVEFNWIKAEETNFSYATFNNVKMERVTGKNVQMQSATIRNSKFINVVLESANFSHAKLEDVTINSSEFQEIIVEYMICISSTIESVVFSEGRFTDATFQKSTLRHVDFKNAAISYNSKETIDNTFYNVNFEGVRWEKRTWVLFQSNNTFYESRFDLPNHYDYPEIFVSPSYRNIIEDPNNINNLQKEFDSIMSEARPVNRSQGIKEDQHIDPNVSLDGEVLRLRTAFHFTETELEIRFPTAFLRDQFYNKCQDIVVKSVGLDVLKDLFSISQRPEDSKCLYVKKSKSPTSAGLYIAKNGEVAINFINSDLATFFTKAFNLSNYERILKLRGKPVMIYFSKHFLPNIKEVKNSSELDIQELELDNKQEQERFNEIHPYQFCIYFRSLELINQIESEMLRIAKEKEISLDHVIEKKDMKLIFKPSSEESQGLGVYRAANGELAINFGVAALREFFVSVLQLQEGDLVKASGKETVAYFSLDHSSTIYTGRSIDKAIDVSYLNSQQTKQNNVEEQSNANSVTLYISNARRNNPRLGIAFPTVKARGDFLDYLAIQKDGQRFIERHIDFQHQSPPLDKVLYVDISLIGTGQTPRGSGNQTNLTMDFEGNTSVREAFVFGLGLSNQIEVLDNQSSSIHFTGFTDLSINEKKIETKMPSLENSRLAPLVVIGMGPAGLVAAIEAAKKGLPVVILENRPHFSRVQRLRGNEETFNYLLSLRDPNNKEDTIFFDEKCFRPDGKAGVVQVKDLQSYLLRKLGTFPKMNVRICRAKAAHVESINPEEQMLTFKPDEYANTEKIKFSNIIAADGGRRGVAQQLDETRFAFTYVDLELQHRHQAVATTSLTIRSDKAIPNNTPARGTGLNFKEAHRSLLLNLGWNEEYFPKIRVFRNQKGNKFFFSGEIPKMYLNIKDKGEKNAMLEAWSKLMIGIDMGIDPESLTNMYNDRAEQDQRQEEKRNLSSTAFELRLMYAKRPSTRFPQNGHMILVGDANKNANFFYGHGMNDAIKDSLVAVRSINSDGAFDPEAYADYQNSRINWLRERMGLEQGTAQNSEQANKLLRKIYNLQEVVQNENIAGIIKAMRAMSQPGANDFDATNFLVRTTALSNALKQWLSDGMLPQETPNYFIIIQSVRNLLTSDLPKLTRWLDNPLATLSTMRPGVTSLSK